MPDLTMIAMKQQDAETVLETKSKEQISNSEYEKMLRKQYRNKAFSRSLRRAKSVYYRNIRSKSLVIYLDRMRKIIFFPQLDNKIRCKRGELVDTSILVAFPFLKVLQETVDVSEIKGSCKAEESCVVAAVENYSGSFLDDSLLHVVDNGLD